MEHHSTINSWGVPWHVYTSNLHDPFIIAAVRSTVTVAMCGATYSMRQKKLFRSIHAMGCLLNENGMRMAIERRLNEC